MPLQISTKRMSDLISRQRREREILKEYYKNQVDWGEMTSIQMTMFLAENMAIQKVLEEVKSKKTTNIKVEQIKLF